MITTIRKARNCFALREGGKGKKGKIDGKTGGAGTRTDALLLENFHKSSLTPDVNHYRY